MVSVVDPEFVTDPCGDVRLVPRNLALGVDVVAAHVRTSALHP
jgi:hypothetical protein